MDEKKLNRVEAKRNQKEELKKLWKLHLSNPGGTRNVIFGYFKMETTTGVGHACVALLRPEKGSHSAEYKAAVAFGSPLDVMNRNKARKIAFGRLFSDRENRNFTFTCKAETIVGVMQDALRHASSTDLIITKGDRQRKMLYSPKWLQVALGESKIFEPTRISKEKKEIEEKKTA